MGQMAQSRRRARARTIRCCALAVGPILLAAPAAGAEADPAIFELGTVVVSGRRAAEANAGSDQIASVVGSRDMRRFSRGDVGAALDLLSGVTVSTNSRNEKTIAVRGFDSRQVPLYIDGIPVYVPYDGYVDFGRFVTADLAAIQVAKGYSSVAYGPSTLGGAINLVSRRPVRNFEGDVSLGVGSSAERVASVNVGTQQNGWYAQAGYSHSESDSFPLSSDFSRTPTEDGGDRDNAARQDRKLSVRLGLTPGPVDEYVLSYYRQEGDKGQPPSTIPAAARFWRWPDWDKESVYFSSRTSLGASERLKVRLYHDRFDNEVDSYTDGTYTRLRTSGRGSVSTGRSIYVDRSNGGSTELESTRFGRHTLRTVLHYKTDDHEERDALGARNAVFEDALVSLGVEGGFRLDSKLHLSLGLSRHELRPRTVFSAGNAYTLPGDLGATDAQAGLFWEPVEAAAFHATLARKTRLPTLKDRYSQRLGTFIENPALQPEDSVNAEIGFRGRPGPQLRLEAAVFHSDISNRIQAVANVSGTLSQMRNAGRTRIMGGELGLSGSLSSRMNLGASATVIDVESVSSPALRPTDLPERKIIAHAALHPVPQIEFLAFVSHSGSRWASNTVQLPGFTLLDLKAVWRPSRRSELQVGVNNLTDRDYALAEGFPAPGRTWLARASYDF